MRRWRADLVPKDNQESIADVEMALRVSHRHFRASTRMRVKYAMSTTINGPWQRKHLATRVRLLSREVLPERHSHHEIGKFEGPWLPSASSTYTQLLIEQVDKQL